jgi:signal transduction histidine kinase
MQFTASYRFVVGMLVVLIVFVFIFSWDELPFPREVGMVCVLVGIAAILARTQLHKMTDQEQARLYFGRAFVTLEFVRQAGMCLRSFQKGGQANSALFLTSRLMIFLYHAFAGFSALQWSHRLANAAIFTIGCWLRPSMSTIGKLHESLITGFCITAGVTFGGALEAALTRSHRREHIARRLRLEVEEQTRLAKVQKQVEQDFFAMACHEVRNPLNGVVGSLRLAAPLLCQLSGSADPREAFEAIVELKSAIVDATLCSDVCLATLYNITSLQRLEAGLLDPVRQPTWLPDIIAKVAAIIRPQLQAGVVCVTNIGGAHHALDTNPKVLVQILTNLAQNAAKHTKAGVVELHAHVTPTATEGLVNLDLAVRDSGPGLSEESKLSCFNKYTTTSGVGLGLYLTKLQAELLGGIITVTSPWSPDHPGSAFCIMLPMCAISASSTPVPVVPPTCEFRAGVRVLVADDVRVNRTLLTRAFTTRFGIDWAVTEVATAKEALEALRAGHDFQLVVMDEIFSDTDVNCMRGSSAIRLLREREAAEGLVSVTVISCTGNASHESGKLKESGANFVWNKPFPSAEDGSMQRDIAMLLLHRDRAS